MIDLNSLRAACPAALGIGLALAIAGNAGAQNVINSNTTIHDSLCVGGDCANTENYGFDTIRMKENNTRLNFVDTSNPPFPTRDWAIQANDSTSGGASYLGIVDRGDDNSGSTIVARFEATAPANSLVVEGDGDVGFGTLNPVAKLHAVKGDTPTLRLEQDGSNGWTPQTWDIAANETNFFVRDVNNASQLPFRIFANSGKDTLIARSGNVGIGTDNPISGNGNVERILQVHAADNNSVINLSTADTNLANGGGIVEVMGTGRGGNNKLGQLGFHFNAASGLASYFRLALHNGTSFDEFMRITSAGFMGIGIPTPSAQLHTTGSVRFAGIANCVNGIVSDQFGNLLCSQSTRRVKNIAGMLEPELALANIMALKPQVGAYKATPDEPEHWLIAEDVAEVEPALVGLKDGEPFTVKTYGVVADLVAVIQLQQRELEAQRKRIDALEGALTPQ